MRTYFLAHNVDAEVCPSLDGFGNREDRAVRQLGDNNSCSTHSSSLRGPLRSVHNESSRAVLFKIETIFRFMKRLNRKLGEELMTPNFKVLKE